MLFPVTRLTGGLTANVLTTVTRLTGGGGGDSKRVASRYEVDWGLTADVLFPVTKLTGGGGGG